MRVVFSPEARLELVEAQRFYNLKQPKLGDRLYDEIRAALPRVQRWPLSCPVERGDIRRLALTRFPYKLGSSDFPVGENCTFSASDLPIRFRLRLESARTNPFRQCRFGGSACKEWQRERNGAPQCCCPLNSLMKHKKVPVSRSWRLG